MKLIAALITMLALVAPATALAVAPTATTEAARDVTATTATVPGKVDPGGEETTFVVEYWVGTGERLRTPAKDVPPGVGPQDVEAALTGLTPSTTYTARIIASNTSDTAEGNEVTFTTAAPPPTAPGAVTRTAADVRPTSARLRGTVDPNRAQTVWYFEFGRTQALGQRTPSRTQAAGDESVDVSATIGGLPQNRRHFFRLVAESSAGTTRGAVRRLTTGREPTAITIALTPPVVSWATGLTVAGRVRGRGISRIPLALERQDALTGTWIEMSTTPADTKGRFSIAVPALYSLTRLRVITRTRIVAVSPQTWAYVAVRVGIAARRAAAKGRVRFEGSIFPAVPNAVASLQKRGRSGTWVRIKRVRMRTSDENRSRYRFGIERPRRGGRYRVAVIPNDDGLHVTGRSRELRLKPLKTPARKQQRRP